MNLDNNKAIRLLHRVKCLFLILKSLNLLLKIYNHFILLNLVISFDLMFYSSTISSSKSNDGTAVKSTDLNESTQCKECH